MEKPFGVNSRVGTSRFRLSCFVKVKHCLSTFFGLHPLHLTGGLKRALLQAWNFPKILEYSGSSVLQADARQEFQAYGLSWHKADEQ